MNSTIPTHRAPVPMLRSTLCTAAGLLQARRDAGLYVDARVRGAAIIAAHRKMAGR